MENGRGPQIQKFLTGPSRNRGLGLLFPSGFPEIKERIRGTDLNFTSRDAAFCPDYSKKVSPEQTNEKNDEKIGASVPNPPWRDRTPRPRPNLSLTP
jgi:hypothetical protein